MIRHPHIDGDSGGITNYDGQGNGMTPNEPTGGAAATRHAPQSFRKSSPRAGLTANMILHPHMEGDSGGYSMPDMATDQTDDSAGLYSMANERYDAQGDDFSELYAKPDKQGKVPDDQTSEDIGALYAMPDKKRKGTNHASEDFGELYAKPDKKRNNPEGRETTWGGDFNGSAQYVNVGQGEGLYSVADDDNVHRNIYANHGPNVGHAQENGTDMVDNELYKVVI